jgi:subtilisin family serine protease
VFKASCKCAILIITLYAVQAIAQDYVPGEVIVKLRGQADSNDSYAFMGKAHSLNGMQLKESWDRMNMHHFALSKGQSVEAALAEIRKDPNVLYAEPNYYIHKSADDTGIQQTFTAESIQEQAAVSAQGTYMATSAPIGVQTVWASASSSGTYKPVVAVIDTGLDTNHFVIQDTQALWVNPGEIPGNGIDDDGNGYVDDVNGWNFVDNNGHIYDDDGHGTHVSGIILSVDQNIYATPLHEAKIRIMPLKFLNGNGVGTTSNAIRAVYYAANMGAAVMNNSWGGPTYSAALHEAVAYSYAKGALFVAAAGNAATDNDGTPMYPASYNVPNVISIAATTDYDYLASFSNYGATTVQLGSPGVYILSTIPGNLYGTSSGTSMATPFVSGTAAQMKVESPNMLGYQMKEILMSQYTPVAQLTGKVSTSGRLDTSDAVTYAKTASVESSQPSYTLTYQADRQLASSIAGAGGCGTVRSLGQDDNPSSGGAGVVVGLLLAPLVMLFAMRMRAPATRRKHERFRVDSDVRIKVGDRELVGNVSSISLGGVQVNTDALLQDGGMITLSIASPNGEERVEVAGRVVWSEANKAYGVAFNHAPQSTLSRIADWTRGLQKAS